MIPYITTCCGPSDDDRNGGAVHAEFQFVPAGARGDFRNSSGCVTVATRFMSQSETCNEAAVPKCTYYNVGDGYYGSPPDEWPVQGGGISPDGIVAYSGRWGLFCLCQTNRRRICMIAQFDACREYVLADDMIVSVEVDLTLVTYALNFSCDTLTETPSSGGTLVFTVTIPAGSTLSPGVDYFSNVVDVELPACAPTIAYRLFIAGYRNTSP